MDTQRFLMQLMQEARSLLRYTDGDVTRAVRVALQDAHAELPQEQFFAAIDTLGGHEAVVQAVTSTLTRPLTMAEVYESLGWTEAAAQEYAPPQRADIEAQIAFEQQYGPTIP